MPYKEKPTEKLFYKIGELANMFGENYPKTYLPERPGEYPTTLCTDKKASTLLGWSSTHNIKTYITKWLEENK